MKITSLNYYENFRCKASDCKHNCCLKWQIDIDKKSLKRYKRVKGSFGETLKNGIDFETNCFKMKNNRCVFLNDKNLCEIFINLGEKSLCQVCSDHPRYRNYFNNKIEVGVGLTCEAITERIVNFEDFAKETVIKKGISFHKASLLEKEIFAFREKVIMILQDRKKTFTNRIEEVLLLSQVDKIKLFSFDIKNYFLKLEILDETWKQKIEKIVENLSYKNILNIYSTSFEQLAIYFVHRHLSNAIDCLDIKTRTVFSMLSVLFIAILCEKEVKCDKNAIISIARQYSEEIEYCDENINSLLDIIDQFVIK